MKDENKIKAELIKESKTLRKEREKSALDDTTKHKQLEEKYQSFTKDILDASKVGIFILNSDFKVVWINNALENYFGLQREKIIGKDKRQLIKENIQHIFEDPDEFIRKVFATYDNNIYIENFECHVLPKGKRKERWLEHWSQPIKSGLYAGGRIEYYYDITERRQAEEELKNSEERLKILFDYAPDAYYTNDSKGIFIDGNKAAEKLTGYKREELIGKSFLKLKLLSVKDMSKVAKALAKNIMGQPTGPDEFVLNRKDNSKVTVEIATYPVKIKGKTLVLGIARDITERKKAEKALADSEKKYRTVFENTGTVTVIVEEDTAIVDANKECERVSGYTISQLIGKSWTKFVYKEDLPIMLSRHISRREDPRSVPDRYEVRLIDAKGKIRNTILSVGMIPGSKKSIVSINDITERKQAEEKLRESHQKLKKTIDAIIDTMSRVIEVKDPYTAGHQQRVSQLATAIAKELNFSPDKIEGIRIASLIHDIGKISVPAEIMSKTTKLTDIEFSLIKGHSQIGYDILKSIDFSYPIAEIILQHHERINGSGYPNHIKGDKILLEAKIIGVADVVEAMSSHRPYRPALGTDKALEEISKNRSILYDPKVVDACLRLFRERGFKFEIVTT